VSDGSINKQGAAQGIWLNRLPLLDLELDFVHDIATEADGSWRLAVHQDGTLRARYVNGDVRAVDLRAGDTVLASAAEIYVGLSERRTARRVKPKARQPIPADEG
jgi:hypothetical protein